MTAVSFNIQTAAALGDKVCKKYLVPVAKGVLVTVIEVDLWFAVTEGQTPACRTQVVTLRFVSYLLGR